MKTNKQLFSGIRSLTVLHALPGDFAGAYKKELEPAKLPHGILKTKRSKNKAAASLISKPIKAAFRFNQLLASAGAEIGKQDTLELFVQVRTAGSWSPWFSFGYFSGSRSSGSRAGQKNVFGTLDTDVLNLNTDALYFRYKVAITTTAHAQTTLKLVAVTYTDTKLPYAKQQAVALPPSLQTTRLRVPPYSQMTQKTGRAGDLCSPASLTMLMNYHGLKTNVLKTADCVIDKTENIYGNWAINTAYPAKSGLYSWLTRFNSLEEVWLYLQAGLPIAASITFGTGELSGAPIEKTKGHLVVIKGFTAKGDVIVNDPAGTNSNSVEKIYDKEEFAAAWLKNKYGTAYILAPFNRLPLTVRQPFTDVYSIPPKPAITNKEKQKIIETQILPLENITPTIAAGNNLLIEAPEQPHYKNPKAKPGPYKGWLDITAAAFNPQRKFDAVIKTKQAALKDCSFKQISIGVKVKIIYTLTNNQCLILLPGDETAQINKNQLVFLPARLRLSEIRKQILQTARQFLGDKYFWGGRSGAGVDCSGLVSLSYRVWGIDLPRNASDQFISARKLPFMKLKPADLIFTTDLNSDKIGHVMLYSGQNRLLEATRESGNVREISFAGKFGIKPDGLKNGQNINGKKIYFGTIFKENLC